MNKPDNNKYTISNFEFVLNTDLDIDESVEANKLLGKLFVQSANVITGDFTGEEIERFLATVLIPADNKELPEGFSFRKAKESVQLAVFRDFFLARMRKGMNIADEFAASMKQQLEQ